MKRAKKWTWLFFIAVIMTTALPTAWGAPPAAPDQSAQAVSSGYLENVTFEKLPGKERVTLAVSKQSGVTVENQPGNALLVRLENLYVPEGLRRPLDDASLANLIRVTPVQKSADGRSWVLATIELRQKVPYSVRQEGMNVIIDFNVTSLAAAAGPEPVKPLPSAQPPDVRQTPPGAEAAPAPAKGEAKDAGKKKKVYTGSRIFLDVQGADIKAVFRLLAEQGNVSIVSGEDVKGTVTLTMKDVPWDQALDTVLGINGLSKIEKDNVIMVMSQGNFLKLKKAEEEAVKKSEQIDTEPLITRVVQVKYRLLTLVKTGKIDVKGDVVAAGFRELAAAGSVLSAPQKESFEGQAAASGTKTQKVTMEGAGDFFALLQSLLSVDSEGKQRGWIGADADTNSVIITAVKSDMIKIMDMIAKIDIPTDQILIKANIVETTKSTARDLGIQWGGAFGRYVGNQSLYVTPGGTGGSTVPPGSALSGAYTPTSGMTGIGGQGYGVNFPAVMSPTVSASLGLLFGTIGGNILEVQLSALQKDGKLNILSSPSITTLDNQMAFTENGLIVPYATTEVSGGVLTRAIKKEEATLRLEIVPHVIDGQKLKMKIVVKKNEVDFTPGHSVDGNPYMIKKQTETNLIVQDGETVVISGLTKQKTQDGVSGIPWLKEIPVLGWLFKGEAKTEEMEEVLIFITPNIIKSQIVTGIQEGV